MILKNVMTDGQLMIAYRGGDNDSLGVLFERKKPQLVKYAKSLIPVSRAGKEQLAEDAVQNAFVRVVDSKNRSSFWQPGKASVSSWLYMVVRNQVRSLIRKKSGSEKVCSDYQVGEEECRSVEQLRPMPNSLAFDFERFFQRVISCLPPDVLDVVVLTLKGLSNKEIATTLKISLPTVSRRCQAARQVIVDLSYGLAA